MFALQSVRLQLLGATVKSVRSLSQLQTETKKTDVDKVKGQQNELEKKPDIASQIDEISKRSKDNFLIEFNERKPTYDQIFEYKIDEKPYLDERPIVQSKYIGPDNMIRMHNTKRFDLSWLSFKMWTRKWLQKTNIQNQKYNVKRHGILGPDLATAHFVTARSGKVRFKHKPEAWILDDKSLPAVFDKKIRLLSVDASSMSLMYEGLDNFILLPELEELILVNNLLDDFCCDKLARIFRTSTALEYLDLSGNKHISNRGIEALHRIPSLKRLIIKDTEAAKFQFLPLLIELFQDVRPECEIIYQ